MQLGCSSRDDEPIEKVEGDLLHDGSYKKDYKLDSKRLLQKTVAGNKGACI